MPKSVASYRSLVSQNDDDEDDPILGQHEEEAIRNAYINTFPNDTSPPSRTAQSARTGHISPAQARSRRPSRPALDESTSLLQPNDNNARDGYRTMSAPGTPRRMLSRQHSQLNTPRRNHSRKGSLTVRLARALATDANPTDIQDMETSISSMFVDDRLHYDQFTSIDWTHDIVADAYRMKQLRSRKDFKGRMIALFDGAQGWIIVAIIGIATAAVAYFVDELESTIFDFKTGYCSPNWVYSKRRCCSGASTCDDWRRWSTLGNHMDHDTRNWADYIAFIAWVVVLSVLACLITLQTRTTISSSISLATLDENLGAPKSAPYSDEAGKTSISPDPLSQKPPFVYYPAAGSGVAEVKVILSGFVLHGYLGVKTLVCKSLGLILSVGSGLSIGKEGPYVHIATCVGNIACRMFTKYRTNDGKRREVLSASAAAGVAVAFGAPIGGVLFSLEEVSYYFPPKTLFRTFCCCIAAALSLKFLDPYGTGKIVLFEVRYLIDWNFLEIAIFILVGVVGGALGALFIKASKFWAQTFRRTNVIKKYPILEVFIVALVTGIISFWNRYTRLPVAELLYELAAPCNSFSDTGNGLCPTKDRIPATIGILCIAFIIKAFLTVVTFGIKVPAGIYVPSMVVGGLMGRIVGHTVQYIILQYPNVAIFARCSTEGNPESCIVPGVYALTAAGATMCGVTRLSVTLAVILFELTGSLEHVLPFSLGILCAKWTADALEPLSIYDLLTDMNSYPYLDAKIRPVFTADLGDLIPHKNRARVIDISDSPLVPAKDLRKKLEYLHLAGELDSAVPILQNGTLSGLIPCPDLEFALDRLPDEANALCLMSPQANWQGPGRGAHPTTDTVASPNTAINMNNTSSAIDADADAETGPVPEGESAPLLSSNSPPDIDDPSFDPTDFTPYIDPAPVALDIRSPMDLVFECFVKLGLRYICVLRDGRFAGLVHKKAFVRHVKDVEEGTHGKKA